jgi:hypothetical protein
MSLEQAVAHAVPESGAAGEERFPSTGASLPDPPCHPGRPRGAATLTVGATGYGVHHGRRGGPRAGEAR